MDRAKTLISWLVGVPAAFIAMCEAESPQLGWMPVLATAVVAVVLLWNKKALEEGTR